MVQKGTEGEQKLPADRRILVTYLKGLAGRWQYTTVCSRTHHGESVIGWLVFPHVISRSLPANTVNIVHGMETTRDNSMSLII